MQKALTDSDISELRYQCWMGYILPAMLFVIGTSFAILIFESYINDQPHLNLEMITLTAFVFIEISIFLSYVMNNKYYTDIRNGEKEVQTKIVRKKESKVYSEAESGIVYLGNKANPYDKYSMIVDHAR